MIVGYGADAPFIGARRRAFRWTAQTGILDIGGPPNHNNIYAAAVNADGSVIVGYYDMPGSPTLHAFVWDTVHEMRDLQTLLLDAGITGELQSWTLNKATDVSADGSAVVGAGTDGQGRTQPFLVRLGAPCYPNCDASTAAPILNILDFNCFLNRFTAGDTYSNCDGSTEPPVLNVLDFNCFLNAFANGC